MVYQESRSRPGSAVDALDRHFRPAHPAWRSCTLLLWRADRLRSVCSSHRVDPRSCRIATGQDYLERSCWSSGW